MENPIVGQNESKANENDARKDRFFTKILKKMGCMLPEDEGYPCAKVTKEDWEYWINYLRQPIVKLMAKHWDGSVKISATDFLSEFPIQDYMETEGGDNLDADVKDFHQALLVVLHRLNNANPRIVRTRFIQLAYWLENISSMRSDEAITHLGDFWLSHACWWNCINSVRSRNGLMRLKEIMAAFSEDAKSVDYREIVQRVSPPNNLSYVCKEEFARISPDQTIDGMSMFLFAELVGHKKALDYFASFFSKKEEE